MNLLKASIPAKKVPYLVEFTQNTQKSLMRKSKAGTKNPLYGKSHTEQTKILMRKAKLGKSHKMKQKRLFLLQMVLPSIYMKPNQQKLQILFY